MVCPIRRRPPRRHRGRVTGIRDIPSGPLLRIGDDRYIPGLKKLVKAVHLASGGRTKLFIQLIDFLRVRRRTTKEKYFSRFFRTQPIHRARLATYLESDTWLVSPERDVVETLCIGDAQLHEAILDDRELSDLRFGARERVTDTHLEHIRELPEQLPPLFAQAAKRAKQAGFDGVELHFAHAYTMASFLSRLNTREDGYGGSPEGRIRLPLDVFHRVRTAVGSDFPVGCRYLVDDVIEGGNRVQDAQFFGIEFARAGMDF